MSVDQPFSLAIDIAGAQSEALLPHFKKCRKVWGRL